MQDTDIAPCASEQPSYQPAALSSSVDNLREQSSSSFQTVDDRPRLQCSSQHASRRQQPPPVVPPLLGRRLTETAETMMFGMQARIASRATERSRAQRARQRRRERRQEQKAAKTLSAILLAFIITWTPYNVFTIIQTFCAECVHQHLYEFGQFVLSSLKIIK